MTSQRPARSPVDLRCAKFLCDLTAFGEDYTVLPPPPALVGVSMSGYTLGQLFDRLANPGESIPCTDRESLMRETRKLLTGVVSMDSTLSESTVLGEIFAGG